MLINFLKSIFTWWNTQTVGTFLFTLFSGKLVGVDQFGNRYHQNKDDSKRWVIYNGDVDSSRIPPEWQVRVAQGGMLLCRVWLQHKICIVSLLCITESL